MPSPTDAPSREEVEALIADLRFEGYADYTLEGKAADTLTALLALTFLPQNEVQEGDPDTYKGEADNYNGLWNDALNKVQAAQARLSEVEKALEEIAEQRLSTEMNFNSSHNADWIGGYDQCIQTARAALKTGGAMSELREKVAKAALKAVYPHLNWEVIQSETKVHWLRVADAVLTLVIDECAKVAENYPTHPYKDSGPGADIGCAIRALHPKEPQ